MSELNYEHVFNVLVDKTAEYVTSNNLKVMVLGISGGIDSTVVAAICHEVSKKTGIPLIGRSLPIKNKSDEFDVSKLVGEAFCDEFKVFNLSSSYKSVLFDLCADTGLIKDCKGYDWYWVSDLEDHYKSKALEALRNDYKAMSCAIYNSCKLVPTDGLGISNSDLDQIGAKDYATVDDILSRFIPFENFRKSYDLAGQIMHPHDEMAESDCWSQLCARHGEDVVNKVWSRHLASEFKRKKAPIYISRELYE